MSILQPQIFTLPSVYNFADSLAQTLWAQYSHAPEQLSALTIFLPNRRACRAMATSFLRCTHGQPLLLPRLQPLGDVDDDDVFWAENAVASLGNSANLLPPMPPRLRQNLLAQLVAQKEPDLPLYQTMQLAADLAHLLDDIHTMGLELKDLSFNKIPTELANHWEKTFKFLDILFTVWPTILAAHGYVDPAQYRHQLISAQAQALRQGAFKGRIIAAGSTGSIPAVGQLLRAIATAPQGCVVLPGFDAAQYDVALTDVQHPQHQMAQWLRMGDIDPATVQTWPNLPALKPWQKGRAGLLRQTFNLQNAAEQAATLQQGLQGFHVLTPHSPAAEVQEVALLVREHLDNKDTTIMVVTPNRASASQLVQTLENWGVAANDSGGTLLAYTPLGQLMAHSLHLLKPQIFYADILQWLKHPLVSVLNAQELSALENAWRGLWHEGDLSSLLHKTYTPEVAPYVAKITTALQPLLNTQAKLESLLTALVTLLENICDGAQNTWGNDDGEAASVWLQSLLEHSATAPDASLNDIAYFVQTDMRQVMVRPSFGAHPRVQILPPIEARLQSADVVVLMGLTEGTWPATPKPDHWLPLSMRAQWGLRAPEFRLGQAALDFANLASLCQVYITCCQTQQSGEAAIPSRWLQQWQIALQQADIDLPLLGLYGDYVAQLQTPNNQQQTTQKPDARIAKNLLPQQLAVTDIAALQKDPYQIFAKRVLKLYKPKPLDPKPDVRDWGNVVHDVLENVGQNMLHQTPQQLGSLLANMATQKLAAQNPPTLLRYRWQITLNSVFNNFVPEEQKLQSAFAPQKMAVEAKLPSHNILPYVALHGRADRIDTNAQGFAHIIDYKTGTAPKAKKVSEFEEPQLPLLAALYFDQNPSCLQVDVSYYQLKPKDLGLKPIAHYTPQDVHTIAKNLDTVLSPYWQSASPNFSPPDKPPKLVHDYYHLARYGAWADTSANDDYDDDEETAA